MADCCAKRERYLDVLVVIHKHAAGTDERVECPFAALRAVRDLAAESAALRAFALSLADRIHAAHEVLARLAERRAVVLTERDACPLG